MQAINKRKKFILPSIAAVAAIAIITVSLVLSAQRSTSVLIVNPHLRSSTAEDSEFASIEQEDLQAYPTLKKSIEYVDEFSSTSKSQIPRSEVDTLMQTFPFKDVTPEDARDEGTIHQVILIIEEKMYSVVIASPPSIL